MSEILPSDRALDREMGLECPGDWGQPSKVSGGGCEVGHHASLSRLGCHAVLVWWKGIQEGSVRQKEDRSPL